MFTLKLYRRPAGTEQTETLIVAAHHIRTIQLAPHTLVVDAFPSERDLPATYYVGDRTPEFTAINDDNHWGWGLLENWEGNTSQHFRPHTYG